MNQNILDNHFTEVGMSSQGPQSNDGGGVVFLSGEAMVGYIVI